MRSIFVWVTVACSLAAGGCLKIAPGDGVLQCAAVGQQCPDGYHCAINNTCWHNGKNPTTTVDMSFNRDMPASVDMPVNVDMPLIASDMVVDMTSTPPGDMTQFMCTQASDCPAVSNPCLAPACAMGMCSPAPSPQGTLLANQTGYVGTCTAVACDGSGNKVVVPAPNNLPTPPSSCYTTACTGSQLSTPSQTPVPAGSPCPSTTPGVPGVCNGMGGCGICKPNTTRCSTSNNTTIQTCSADGTTWNDSSTCSTGVCSNGICAGTCNSATYIPSMCSGNAPIVCVNNNTQAGTACTNSTCVNGKCTGSCVAGTQQCDSTNSIVQLCSSMGTWTTQYDCPQMYPNEPLCVQSGSTATCLQCNAAATPYGCCTASSGFAGTRQCTNGTWGTCNECGTTSSWSCSGNGVCACSSAGNPCGAQCAGTKADACGTIYTCNYKCPTNYFCSDDFCKLPPSTTTTTIKPVTTTCSAVRTGGPEISCSQQ